MTTEGLYLSESLDLLAVFFRLGAGILHSMEKATQFVPVGNGKISVLIWLTGLKAAHKELPKKPHHILLSAHGMFRRLEMLVAS